MVFFWGVMSGKIQKSRFKKVNRIRKQSHFGHTFLVGSSGGGGESTHVKKALLYTQQEQQNVFFGNSSSRGIVRDDGRRAHPRRRSDDDDAKNITKDVIITDNFQQKNNFYFYENSKSVVCFVRGTGEQDGWKCDTAWFWWSQSFVVVYVVVGVRVERSDQNAKEDTNEKDGNGNNVYLLQNIFIVLAGCCRASIVVIS
jgi:hypothetical protein